jgi:hypothetical protein
MRKLSFAVFVLLASVTIVHAADNYVGVWALNVAKSKYSPGPPAKSQTTKLETVSGGGLREIGDRTNADGSKTHWEFTAKYDGKDYPVTGDPDRDTVALKRVDDNTLEVVNKKAGKVTNRMTILVAKDGKSRTNTATGTNAKGIAINNVLFFDRQ